MGAMKQLEEKNRIEKIRQLNDELRTNNDGVRGKSGGTILYTAGVAALEKPALVQLVLAVKTFDDFTDDNDPYGEHDFGSVEVEGLTYFWKIDYYDKSMQYGSDDPENAAVTTRVLTIMRADEY